MIIQKKHSLSILTFLFFSFGGFAQIEIKDGSKVGVIVTGQGNNLNVTQIFGKSPEYAELTRSLTRLDTLIQRKIVQCKKLQVANIMDLYSECQKELGDFNAERDSVAKIEKQFKEDVQRLAETFSKIPINSERLKKAKTLFDKGRIREVQFVMNDKEMAAEGDALLKEKERLKRRTERIDSLLEVKAEEYRVKAQAKALDYTDPMRIDSTAFCYRQSLRYADKAQTLYDFAKFFLENNLNDSAFLYYPKIIVHLKAEDWQIGNAYISLGELHKTTGNLNMAMENDLKAIEIYYSLHKKDSTNTLYTQNLAVSYSKLGNTHTSFGNLEKALGFHENEAKLFKELYAAYPNNVDFKNGLAVSYQYLGYMHTSFGNLEKALGFYEEYNCLEQELYAAYPNNADFKNGLAISYQHLGITQMSFGNLEKALGFYENEAKLFKELYAAYPNNVDFKKGLAISYQYLGYMHISFGNLEKALGFYEEYNRLEQELYAAYPNNVDFKNGLAISYRFLGITNTNLNNLEKALKFYKISNQLSKELYAAYPNNVDFKNDLAISYQFLGNINTNLDNLEKALGFYEDFTKLMKELNATNPNNVKFKNGLAISYGQLGAFSRYNLKDKTKARAYFQQAETLWMELVRDAPLHVEFQQNLEWVQTILKELNQ